MSINSIRCSIWNRLDLGIGCEIEPIIKSPEFQRLRNLKQLGFVYQLYPGATHSRYEHCLGTAHLCKRLLDTLERNSKVTISQFHKKCVIVAGLLHDVGHGPFSHAWERIGGRHEEMSILLVKNILGDRVPKFFSAPERLPGIYLVQSLINGDASLLSNENKYLAEIVSNKYCEIDVDKWDYLMRDMFYLRSVDGVAPVDSFRFFERAKIQKDAEGVSHIGYSLEDVEEVRHFFQTRRQLRRKVYLHPSVEESEIAFSNLVMNATRAGFRFNGRSISEASEQPSEFQFLTDSILNHLEIWMENNRQVNPVLHEEFVRFTSFNQFTNYCVVSDIEEAVQWKSPLFYPSDPEDNPQRIRLPY